MPSSSAAYSPLKRNIPPKCTPLLLGVRTVSTYNSGSRAKTSRFSSWKTRLDSKMTADNPNTIALIQSLNKQVLAAQAAYYSGEPILSDAEYDTLEARLKGIVQSSPWLAEHATSLHKPGDAPLASGRVKHIRPMLSFENKYTKPEITDFFLTLPTPLMLAEPKRDGISCELRYRDGQLVQALSRGSGTEGEDMTAQVKVLLSIPKTLLMENTPGVYVRHS